MCATYRNMRTSINTGWYGILPVIWYWGAFDDENKAIEAANNEDGMVVIAE